MTLPHCPEHQLELLTCNHCLATFLVPLGFMSQHHCLSCGHDTGAPALDWNDVQLWGRKRYNDIMPARLIQEAALRATQEMNHPPEN